MGRRKNAAHKSARMPVTRGLALRSRVPGNWHARFCSRGGGSDSLAYCNLLTLKDQRQALLCIREHLADEGRLVFNIFDPSLEIIAAHLGPLGSALKKDSEFIHPATGHRVIVWDTRQYDPEQQMLEQYFIFEELEDEGRLLVKTYSPLTLRYVYRYEMRYLLELCGYKVEALFGDFRRGPFRYGGEQVWVARKEVSFKGDRAE